MPRIPILIVAAAVAACAAPAAAQTAQDADKFIKLVQSYDYEKLIGGKVLETDQQMAPPCNGERKIEGRQIVAIVKPPQFVDTRAVPVAGEWRERVIVGRCGKQVLAAARRTNPSCKRLDIVETTLRDKDAAPGQPWTEIWTSWVCGVLTHAEVRYAPKPGGGVDFRVR